QSATAAIALQLVAAVGDLLQFIDHELRDDELTLDDARLHDVGDSPIDQHAGIEQDRPSAFGLLAELDVRNHEAKVVLGLKGKADRQIASDYAQEQVDRLDEPLSLVGECAADPLLDEELDDEAQRVSDDQADEQA